MLLVFLFKFQLLAPLSMSATDVCHFVNCFFLAEPGIHLKRICQSEYFISYTFIFSLNGVLCAV